MPGPWEQYATQAPADGPWTRYGSVAEAATARQTTTMPEYDAMGAPTGNTMEVAAASAPQSGFGRYADDVVKGAGAGLVRGAAAVAGAPADVGNWAASGARATERYFRGESQEEYAGRVREREANAIIPPTSSTGQALAGYFDRWGGSKPITEALESNVTGPLYKPEMMAGKVAAGAAEFVPGAVLGPGNVARNAVMYGAVPGAVSELAGQAVEGSAAEPWVRGGAAIAAGGLGAMATRPNTAGASVQSAMRDLPHDTRTAILDRAEALFQEAQQQGVPLSRANAVDAVSNGATNLSNLQRMVEGSGAMRPFYAGTEQGVENAGRAAFEQIAPRTNTPSAVGPQVSEAAQGVIGDTQAGINRATRPLYQQAERQRIGPQIQGALANDPLYARTLEEIRGNPALNRTIEHLPDDAVGVQDLVQRRMRESADNARVPGQASTSNLAAANYEDARSPIIAAADMASGSRPAFGGQPAQVGSYEAARGAQQQLRQQYLEPLMAGPIGKLSKQTEVKGAIEALFPANPVPNSAREVMGAVGALSAKNPWAARQLMRAHVESVFNEATQRLQSGPNQWGGAGFAAALRGNRQQAENLAAGISALPNGPQLLNGFDRFLNVLEATGARQRIGSQTAFNAEELARLKGAGYSEGAIKVMAGGGVKLPQKIMDAMERWRLGRNVNEIADLFTNPEAARVFRELAEAPVGSRKAMALAGRLTALGLQGTSLTVTPLARPE